MLFETAIKANTMENTGTIQMSLSLMALRISFMA